MRKEICLDRDWRFHLDEAIDANFMGYDDRAWREVTLPHDWAVEQPFDVRWSSGTGYLPGGIGWYRKHFFLSEEEAGKQVRLTFQGVSRRARVWINSNYLGQHAYAYTSFSFDITEFIRPGENVIAVRVEHTETADSRWYTGSGIDRHVLLTLTDPVCFREHGVFAVTQGACADRAEIRIQYATEGASSVRFRMMTREGKIAGRTTGRKPSGMAEMEVIAPRLWSPEDPYLYTLRCEALADGKVRDRTEIPFG
ncbi:MAG: sugar-binding domain-containing protein, partial [Clostridia bacterium]